MKKPSGTRLAVTASALALLLFIGTLVALVLATTSISDNGAGEASVEGIKPKRVLRIGRIPSVSPREAYRVYSVLIEEVEKHLDCCELDLVLTPDYASCVEQLEAGALDIAWLATASYVRSRGKVSMIPLVRPIWKGRKGYTGLIFTVEGTGIESLQDLKGKRMAFVDRDSASGYIYPAILLRQAGIDIDRDLARADFLGSHDAVLMAVLLGEYDAGAVFDGAYETVADRAQRVSLRMLAQTPPIPGEPIVANAGLDPAIREEVKEAFLATSSERFSSGRLRDLFGFEPATDEQYVGLDDLGEK